ncbi:MAG: M15 family metallopeptidase, partial [Bdellovibrionales bacterium]|nr:M15 family metallopeptidase [Bdellovibrionales bacterium]
EYAPEVIVDLKFRGSDNFVGEPVDGYKANTCYLTELAAKSLARASVALKAKGYQIVALDCTRPQRAVNHFVRWTKTEDSTEIKSLYYPDFTKPQLFKKGYIASKSGHSRGSTIDLTIVKLGEKGEAPQPVDMGTRFDFFGPASHTKSELISDTQQSNRMILRDAMVEAGFKNYSKEWWHYTLRNEPFRKTYFDFEIN